MFQREAIGIVLLLSIITQQHTSLAVQSLDDFFPFGIAVGDTRIERGDDNSHGPISLPYIFPYFDNNHRQIYQANNGLFSFLSSISTYNPIPFPTGNNQRLITPFWSDIDTRGNTGNPSDNSVYYHVYTQASSNSSNATTPVFDKVALYVRQYFPRIPMFNPLMVIIGTWYRVGYYHTKVDRLNTFQMVLATDESRSFVFFLYNDLQWASQSGESPYAQAGFNAGDGLTATMLKYSRTRNITLLVNESNVNVPGLFAFRVDTNDVEAGGCSEDKPLTHVPVRGDQIGGTTINLQGPCFDTNTTEILCRFGDFGTVYGLIQNEFRVSCISPLAAYSASVELSISFDGGTTFISSGLFTYMAMNDDTFFSEEVIIRKNGTVEYAFSWNDTIEVEWMFSEASLAGISPDTLIDVDYEIIEAKEETVHQRDRSSGSDVDIASNSVIILATGIRPQPGRQTIQIELTEVVQKQQRILPLSGIAIGAFRVSMYMYRGYKIYRQIKKVIKTLQRVSEIGCDSWGSTQPDPSTWNQNLLPCPNTLRQARVARAQYEPDVLCRNGFSLPTWVPIIGNCWFHQGRPQFDEDSAVACYRSVKWNSQGSGSQCCYNNAGQIITRGTGAGSDDRYHSGKTFWRHQFHDVLPFLACCKLQSNPNKCDKYLQLRPPRPGSDTMGQFGGTWGDPHFLTLDGTAFTFNGYGEYTYLVVPSQESIVFDPNSPLQFESQIRTTPLGSSSNDVTAIRAFAAQRSSLNISITLSRRDQLLVHLNGDELTFEPDSDVLTELDTITLRFDDFIITKNLTNDQFTLLWSLGINIQVTPVFVNAVSTRVLNVGAAVSGELKGNWTLGLIGGYDGNPLNDLRDKHGIVVGTVDTIDTQRIHELFGMSWAIDPIRSLFYYESNDNASFYVFQNQNYRPRFNDPIAGSLESIARVTCGIPMNSTNTSLWSPVQRTCYYDISVTRDVDFGRTSLQEAEQQFERRAAIRNPPKFNSELSLTQSVRIGQQVSISFLATSEFSAIIAYQLLHGPNEALLDEFTGQFQWKIPRDMTAGSRIPVKVSARDMTYNLTSTYEVVLELQQQSDVCMFSPSIIALLFSLTSRIMLQ